MAAPSIPGFSGSHTSSDRVVTPTRACFYGGMPRLATTIGVHAWTLEAWLDALRDASVTQVLDVRQRRGVRGSRYAWANSVRLQAALAGARIEYRHHRELAPTTELRQLQHREDARRGVGKRSRVELAADYRRRYLREILGQVALRPIVEAMPVDGAAALLCVEADPEACHRSLVAERLEAEFGLPVEHLTPPGYARMRSLDGS